MQVATIKIGKVENGYVLNVSVPHQGWARFLLSHVQKVWVARNREELGVVLQSISSLIDPTKGVKETGTKNKQKTGA